MIHMAAMQVVLIVTMALVPVVWCCWLWLGCRRLRLDLVLDGGGGIVLQRVCRLFSVTCRE